VADSLGDAIVSLLDNSEGLMADVRELLPKVEWLVASLDARTRALREAPMPYAESTLDIGEWHEAYSEWWHANASEEALGG
jgi:hypothetical protein